MSDTHDEPGTPEDDDLTPESLNAKLKAYQAAIRSEFETTTANDKSTSATERQAVRDFYKMHAARAAAQIVWIADNANSLGVRLNACKTIISEAYADVEEIPANDPIADLLAKLTATAE